MKTDVHYENKWGDVKVSWGGGGNGGKQTRARTTEYGCTEFK